jgi:hypothetical protein
VTRAASPRDRPPAIAAGSTRYSRRAALAHPTSQDPESAQIKSGSQWQPVRKLPVLIGAKPRCPFGQTIRGVWLAKRRAESKWACKAVLVRVANRASRDGDYPISVLARAHQQYTWLHYPLVAPIAFVISASSATRTSASIAARTKSLSRASSPFKSITFALPSPLVMVCSVHPLRLGWRQTSPACHDRPQMLACCRTFKHTIARDPRRKVCHRLLTPHLPSQAQHSVASCRGDTTPWTVFRPGFGGSSWLSSASAPFLFSGWPELSAVISAASRGSALRAAPTVSGTLAKPERVKATAAISADKPPSPSHVPTDTGSIKKARQPAHDDSGRPISIVSRSSRGRRAWGGT